VLGLAVAGAFAVVLHANSVPPERGWAPISLPLAWATPALLAVLARWRPVLLLPAAVLGVGLAVLSLSGVTLLLLVPAGLCVAALAGASPAWPGPVRMALLLALPLGGMAAFAAARLVHEDPVCWEQLRAPDGGTEYRTLPGSGCSGSSGTASGSSTGPVVGGGSTSDTVTAAEAAISAALVATTLVVGWVAAGPATTRSRGGPGAPVAGPQLQLHPEPGGTP
jgi:hypothetical protein